MTTESEKFQFKITPVRRVRDAIGAYCLTCQRQIADQTQRRWHWRKSQLMHERATGHKTIMYTLK